MEHQSQIKDGLALEESCWKAQRWFFLSLILLILVAVIGIFGSGGLFSSADASSNDQRVTVKYPRFSRSGATEMIRLEILPNQGSRHQIIIPHDFLDVADIVHVYPLPEETRRTKEGLVLEPTPAKRKFFVFIYYRPVKSGLWSSNLRYNRQSEVEMTQLIYP